MPTGAGKAVSRAVAVQPARVPKEVGVFGCGEDDDTGLMTTSEENKRVVDEFIQALFTEGDVSATDRCLAAEFIANDRPMPDLSGDAAGFQEAATRIRAAFPDWRSDVHLLLAEGDFVAEHFTASGTQQGDFMGVSATNRFVRVPGINIYRLQDGKITERWGILDMPALFAQLGASPRSAGA